MQFRPLSASIILLDIILLILNESAKQLRFPRVSAVTPHCFASAGSRLPRYSSGKTLAELYSAMSLRRVTAGAMSLRRVTAGAYGLFRCFAPYHFIASYVIFFCSFWGL
jgi:hypothetical protein